LLSSCKEIQPEGVDIAELLEGGIKVAEVSLVASSSTFCMPAWPRPWPHTYKYVQKHKSVHTDGYNTT
jgi:hypothetical protein